MDLATILRSVQTLGPIVAGLPAFRDLYDVAVSTLSDTDQATAKEAYADVMANNDEGHARLQDKLAAAAAR